MTRPHARQGLCAIVRLAGPLAAALALPPAAGHAQPATPTTGPAQPRAHLSPDAPAAAGCYLRAYPEQLCGATAEHLVWCDGTRMPWRSTSPAPTPKASPTAPGAPPPADAEVHLDRADLLDQVSEPYPVHPHWRGPATGDPGRLRHDPFFLKMYGDSPRAVGARTRAVKWAVHPSGQGTLRVTTVNGVADRLARVVAAVARLPEADRRAVATTAGAFVWRTIKGTERLSLHSFAIAVDVGVPRSDYWRWVKPGPGGSRPWRNRIPPSVAAAFEAEGFIWGAKWKHFDTMHFEYRPELLDPACAAGVVSPQGGPAPQAHVSAPTHPSPATTNTTCH